MGLPRASVNRPVLTSVLFAVSILLGFVAIFTLPVELYQGGGHGIVSIIVRARGGLAPIEVEHMITRPIEEVVSTVSKLKSMYSNSREAEGRVTLQFEPGTDMRFAALEVREKFSRVRSRLPDEIEKPVIANYQESDAAIFIFSVTSEVMTPEEMRALVDQELKPRLDQVDKVASTEVFGGRERKILVELDRDKMFAYNISVERVMDVIGASNISLLAGSFERGTYDFAIRTMGAFKDIEEIGAIGIKATRQGSIIPLSEIATIKDSYLEPEDYARLNLDQNVSVYVKKSSVGNTIKVVKSLKRVLQVFEEEQKDDIRAVIVSDKAKLITRAIGDVRNALLLGSLLVASVVFLALRRWILSVIVLAAIPVSVVSTFMFMNFLGLSINVMTLSGVALSIGILVDSAVVVIENAVKKREEGLGSWEAVIQGAEEMWLPLLASLLTSLCVFLPIIFIDEEVKLRYQGFTFTVCAALTMSLLAALMFIPVLLSKTRALRSEKAEKTLRVGLTGGSWFEKLRRWYERSLRRSFQLRYICLVVVSVVFLFAAWRLAVRDIDLPTQLEESEFEVIVFPLAGAKLDANNEVAQRLEDLLNEINEVEMVSTTVQKDDVRIFVRLVPRAKRKLSKEVIMQTIEDQGNEAIKQVHDEYSLIVDEGTSSEESKKLVVNIFGVDGDELERLARQMAKRMSNVNGLTNLVMTDLRKRPEYSVIVDDKRAGYYGFTVRDIADSIHAQVRGMRPTKFHELEKGREIETITRLQPVYRQKIEDLQEIFLVSPKDGTQVALKQVAGLYPTRGPQSIDRKDKYRYVFVKGDTNRPLETVAKEVKSVLSSMELPRDYFWRFGGKYEDLLKGQSQLTLGVGLSIGLIYMVLACLYQSYREPLFVMIAIPLAAIGVWAALFFARKPLSEQVYIGGFILVGYAVNSAIILIDRINHLQATIPDPVERLVMAGEDRLRPILVTTLSTVVGFIPMAMSRSESAELWSPLAVTMIGGIVSSTFLTLFVVPNVYLLFEDLKRVVDKMDWSYVHKVIGISKYEPEKKTAL